MIVMQSRIPVMTCPIASQMPATTNQITLPSADQKPAVGWRITVRPNGHSAYAAIRNDAIPNGMVTIRMQQMTPATAYPIAIQIPQRTSQMTFSRKRTRPI